MRRTENAMGGRDEEFRELIRNRASLLHQSAYLLCGDWHLAHGLVQDTLVKAYQHWPRVRQADSPDAYVRRILLNEARGRAGVLRLLSTISAVTVNRSTTGGQSTLTLTAGPEVFGGSGEQVLTISASTGMPVK